MGKHKPVHTVEKCDEWLSTRTKRKVSFIYLFWSYNSISQLR